MDRPERGALRIFSNGPAHSTRIEVADGEGGWIPVRGVVRATWGIDGPDKTSKAELEIEGAFFDIWQPKDTVGLLILAGEA